MDGNHRGITLDLIGRVHSPINIVSALEYVIGLQKSCNGHAILGMCITAIVCPSNPCAAIDMDAKAE
jgi:hypothetical protein